MQKLGRYALSSPLGKGGMGTVHLGRLAGPAGFSRVVAVKRLHPQFAKDPDFVAMFVDEALITSRIHHPNVVQTLDVVAEGGELFLVMEYVLGEPLSRLQALAGGPLPPPIACAIALGALRGLVAAHETKDATGRALGIVHRDVCPANILVGADGLPRVFDFGIAKAKGRLAETREGVVKGKLAYMPPEQAMQGLVDRRSDLYSLGVVLWEMLAGRPLFDGADDEVLARVLAAEIPRPCEDEKLAAVVLRATRREARDRFPSATAMLGALEDAVTAATASELGAWVASVAGEELEGRAAAVAALEAEGRSVTPRRGSRRRTAWLVGGVACAGVAVTVLVSSAAPPPAPPSAAAAARAPAPPPPAETAVRKEAALPSSEPALGARPAPAPPRRSRCNPPYWYDARGIKHYKIECQKL